MLCCPSFGVVVVVVVGSNYLYLLKLKIFSFYLQHEGAKCDVLEPGSGTLGWGWCVVLAEHRTGPAIAPAPAPDQYCTVPGQGSVWTRKRRCYWMACRKRSVSCFCCHQLLFDFSFSLCWCGGLSVSGLGLRHGHGSTVQYVGMVWLRVCTVPY